ncbi:MAG: glycosyltransferase [Candidatus Omnitrophota bacterium]
MKDIKVAITHDWITGMRGGEKCLEVFCELFPEATVFTLLHKKGSVSPIIEKMDIRTSFIDRFPNIYSNYRWFLPLFPKAIEKFDLTGYDLVISSSHCVAKGVGASPGALHICYCYTPMRYAWKFFDEYFSKGRFLEKAAISEIIKALKGWDITSNKRIDYFIAISDNIRNRIKEIYNRDADVIYPPVNTSSDEMSVEDNGEYLIVSALVPYKRIDLAVNAFNETGRILNIVGTGNDLNYLKKISGENIRFFGWITEDELKGFYKRCKALIFPGEEDFGIVPVEAQGYGKPVIAYGKGGVLETVIPFGEGPIPRVHPTGIFFHKQTPDALNGAIDIFERNQDEFNPQIIKENTARFNRERFKNEIREYIRDKWEKHENTR